MVDDKIVEEKPIKVSVDYRAVELIYGNPVVFGIMVLGIVAVVSAIILMVVPTAPLKDIIIPAMSGIGGLAGGMAISKLANK
jgi:hypothetical protein